MNKQTFATKVRMLYEKARMPLAYMLVIAAVGLRFIPGKEYAFGALIALCLVMLSILFEIHKSVTSKESPRCFTSFTTATISIQQALDSYIQNTRNPSIRVLGIVLYHQWQMLDTYLSHTLLSPNPPQLNLQIALLYPDWSESAQLNKVFPVYANSNIASIEGFINQHKERVVKQGWNIEVWTYRYTPHWFGILAGENLLFLGRSFWDNGVLRGGSNGMEMLVTGDDFLGSQKIEEFQGWFQQCQQQKVEIGMNK
ncbi:MAG: hypothetical protein HY881_09740 [Deltaproteobacteria bacterium]|nr:hypothetical protein [Deltaproteobacteria bacterium]